MLDLASIREVLDGRRGPYADPRTAIDSLDNVAVLVADLDTPQRIQLSTVLLDLLGDGDVVIATAAVLALGQLGEMVDPGGRVPSTAGPGP